MAIEPQNLIQIQSELQDPALVTTQKLMEYANGTNPMVPSYLALIEMNRRKHIEDTSKAFDESNKATVKDQITSSLLAPKQFTNPAALPQGINMGIAPPQVDPTANPFGSALTQQPNMVNPAAAPVQAAEGGLMSIAVGNFDSQNFAGGGIVAFQSGGLNDEEKRLSSFPEARDSGKPRLTDAQILRELDRASAAGIPAVAPAPAPSSSGFQGILSTLPPVEKPKEKSLEELAAERKDAQRIAGVSADPYAESTKRMQAMEARQGKINEEAGLNRLLAQLSAFSSADPSQGLAYAGAESVKASQALEKEQNALRDKQEMAQIEYARAVAKEEDARRNKDAEGILAAQAAQQKAQFDYQKAEHDRGMLAAHIYQTDEQAKTRREATQARLAATPDPTDKLFNSIMGRFNQSKAAAILAKRLQDAVMGSDEYNEIKAEIYKEMKPYFAKHPELLPPPPEETVPRTPAEKPGWEAPPWLRSIIGGPAPKTVSYDQLPK